MYAILFYSAISTEQSQKTLRFKDLNQQNQNRLNNT